MIKPKLIRENKVCAKKRAAKGLRAGVEKGRRVNAAVKNPAPGARGFFEIKGFFALHLRSITEAYSISSIRDALPG